MYDNGWVVHKVRHVRVHRRPCDASMATPVRVEVSPDGGFRTANNEVLTPDNGELHLVKCRKKVGIEMPAVEAKGPSVMSLNAAITHLMNHECTTCVYIEEGVWEQFRQEVKEGILGRYDSVYITPT